MLSFRRFSLLSALFVIGLTSCEPDEPMTSEAVDALPLRSAMVFKINDAEGLGNSLQRSAVFQELDTLNIVRNFRDWVTEIPVEMPEDYHPENMWGAVHASGANTYDLLFTQKSVSGLTVDANDGWTSRAYGNTTIYSVSKNNLEWHVASLRGVDILSSNPRLIEESLRQLESGFTLNEDADFGKVLRTSNRKDPVNLFINYKEVGEMLESTLPNAPLNWVGNMGTWAGYDFNAEGDRWMFTGVHLNPDSANSWLSCFSGNRTGTFEAQELLPTNTAQAIMVSAGNFRQYQRRYTEYLRRDDRLRLFTPQIEQLEPGIDELLFNWAGEEFGLISLETSPDAIAQPRVAYIRANDIDAAAEALQQQANPDFIENHRNYLIHQSQVKNLLLLGYGRIFKDMVNPYYAFHDDYVIFGNNLLTIKGFINDLIDGRTLQDQAGFSDVESELTNAGHVRIWHKSPGNIGLFRRLVDTEHTDEIDDYSESLERIAWSAVQYKVDGEVSYSQVLVQHREEFVQEAKQLWAVPLQGEVLGSPRLVRNHYTKKNEIIVQDESNSLYLIDHSGKVLWSRVLDGPILGEVSQVDLFRNDKLQLALNTEKFIYIIDRNGNDVAPFPVALPQTASAPMAVFDYDGARNYRFVIPCGNRVFNYTKEAERVDGWVFPTTSTPVLRQPQHFSVNGRDFIVIREKSGQIHLVSRRGETRIESQDPLPDTHNDLYLAVGQSQEETRIVTLGEDGRLISLFMNGTVDFTDIDLDSDPGDMVFGDGRYIITQNGHLVVKDDLHPFDIDLDAQLSKPLYFVKNGEPMYGVVIPDLDQVWLYDREGNPLPGLPLYGSSRFTIGELDQRGVLYLVVGTEDGNLLNYRLE